jgi:stage II sporulation protein M
MKKMKFLKEYVNIHKKECIIFLCIILLGILTGIIFLNRYNELEFENINKYIQDLVSNIKSAEKINKSVLLLESLRNNCLFIILIWFLGCTIIGSFLIYLACFYKGFTIGYTIAALIKSLGIKSGIIFTLLSMVLQNIIILFGMLLLCNSGIRIYLQLKRNCVNLKKELIRHTLVMLISLLISIVSSFLEIYGSVNFLIFFKKFL